MSTVAARAVQSIAELSAEQWNACAGNDNPFVRHEFLSALEESGAVSPQTGWAPYHIVIENDDGTLRGCVPMYLKSHSQGEYVFDYSWAHAYENAGRSYYPKLQVSIPFSPVTGPRLLAPDAETRDLLLSACIQFADTLDVSSLHITFPCFEDWKQMGDAGLLLRKDQQFIWHNNNYTCFDDFLQALNSRKRKNIRKERQQAVENDVEIEQVSGAELTEKHWDAFFQFYIDTSHRKWGSAYLNRRFFSLIGESMADKILLVLCKRQGRYIAGALNLIGTDALYGRNWGCIEDHPSLHFEACYYQAIDYAIAHGLERVEAGAQGPHKLSRGYMPEFTYSAHWVADAGFRQAIANFLKEEGAYVESDRHALSKHGPFKNAGQG